MRPLLCWLAAFLAVLPGCERAQRPETQAAMSDLASLWRQGPKAQLSPQEERRLRSLGYLE